MQGLKKGARALIVSFAITVLTMAAPSAAYSAQELRFLGQNFGLKPQQARQLLELLDSQSAKLGELASQRNVDRRALRAAALRLGAHKPDVTLADFIRIVEGLAGQAAESKQKNDKLRALVERLDPGEVRQLSEAALTRAQRAFDEGRFEDAEAAYAELEGLRGSTLENVRDAWRESVLMRISLAALSGENERASELADRAALQALDWGRHDAWMIKLADANQWYQRGSMLGDNAALQKAITLYRGKVLPLAPEDTAPADWRTTQSTLAVALSTLGDREPGTGRLDEAVHVYRSLLGGMSLERDGDIWLYTQLGFGAALYTLGNRLGSNDLLKESMTTFQPLLSPQVRHAFPLIWAHAQSSVGILYGDFDMRLGDASSSEKAIVAFRHALEEFTPERAPIEWANTQKALGTRLQVVGDRTDSKSHLEESITAYQLALTKLRRDNAPLLWASTQNSLGNVYVKLGEMERNRALLERGISAFELALLEWTRERVPLDWARVQNNLAIAYTNIGIIEDDLASLEKAAALYGLAMDEATKEREPLGWAMKRSNAALVLALIGELSGQTGKFDDAVAAYREALLTFEGLGATYYVESVKKNIIEAEQKRAAIFQRTAGSN